MNDIVNIAEPSPNISELVLHIQIRHWLKTKKNNFSVKVTCYQFFFFFFTVVKIWNWPLTWEIVIYQSTVSVRAGLCLLQRCYSSFMMAASSLPPDYSHVRTKSAFLQCCSTGGGHQKKKNNREMHHRQRQMNPLYVTVSCWPVSFSRHALTNLTDLTDLTGPRMQTQFGSVRAKILRVRQ